MPLRRVTRYNVGENVSDTSLFEMTYLEYHKYVFLVIAVLVYRVYLTSLK